MGTRQCLGCIGKHLRRGFVGFRLDLQRAEAVSRAAASIANDFSNLLAPLRSSAEVLDKHIPTSAPLRQQVEDILDATKRGDDTGAPLEGGSVELIRRWKNEGLRE